MGERLVTRICFQEKITHLGGEDWWSPVEDVLEEMGVGLRHYYVDGILGREKVIPVRPHGAFGIGYVRATNNETAIDNLAHLTRFDRTGRKEVNPLRDILGLGIGSRAWKP